MVCFGTGCCVTFSNCTFSRCTLAVLRGAKVTMKNCAFVYNSSAEKLSLFVHGRRSSCTMSGGSMSGGYQGVACHDGASLQLTSVTIEQVAITSIEVKDLASEAKVNDCSISNMPTTWRKSIDVSAMLVHVGASATVSGLTVQQCEFGVNVEV